MREALSKSGNTGRSLWDRRPHTCRGGNRKNSIPDGSPIPSCSQAENTGVCSYRKKRHFSYNRRSVFSLLSGSSYRGAITGKSQMGWIHQSVLNRTIQELLAIEPENKGKRIFLFQLPTIQQREKLGSGTGRVTGSLITFPFPFGRFHFREPIFWGKMIGIILPDAGKEIIKSPDTRSIPEGETAEDGIKRSFPEHAAPDGDGSYFQSQSKQIGAQHAGRKPGFRAKNRVTFLHNGIGQGKIEIPKLHDIIPSAFRKHKGIRIKF